MRSTIQIWKRLLQQKPRHTIAPSRWIRGSLSCSRREGHGARVREVAQRASTGHRITNFSSKKKPAGSAGSRRQRPPRRPRKRQGEFTESVTVADSSDDEGNLEEDEGSPQGATVTRRRRHHICSSDGETETETESSHSKPATADLRPSASANIAMRQPSASSRVTYGPARSWTGHSEDSDEAGTQEQGNQGERDMLRVELPDVTKLRVQPRQPSCQAPAQRLHRDQLHLRESYLLAGTFSLTTSCQGSVTSYPRAQQAVDQRTRMSTLVQTMRRHKAQASCKATLS